MSFLNDSSVIISILFLKDTMKKADSYSVGNSEISVLIYILSLFISKKQH